MTVEPWINETLYTTWGQRFCVTKELARVKSEFQDILIFECESHGRVLMLDGVVQITEKDEFVYQEMLTHVPLLMHAKPRRVLIIGAGDGGVLRRVLEHQLVEHVVMVELDGEVIRLAREFMPSISGTCWDDPRAEVMVGDGIAYVLEAASESFDVIIVDSTDPIGVGEVLFTDSFYENCARILTADGLIVNQCGVPFMQADELRLTSERRAKFFKCVSAYVAAVPTYVGGFMTLGIASKSDIFLHALDIRTLSSKAQQARILGKTRYWSPALHVGSFSLPPYIAEHLPTRA